MMAGVEKFIFLHQKTATKGISLSKLPIIFFPVLFLKVNQKGLFFGEGFSYFFQNPRVQRMAIGNISRRPISIRSAQMYLATGERMDHEWTGP